MDLIPNGRNTNVTDDNKLEYVQRITHHRMTHSIRGQIEAFLEGKERRSRHIHAVRGYSSVPYLLHTYETTPCGLVFVFSDRLHPN